MRKWLVSEEQQRLHKHVDLARIVHGVPHLLLPIAGVKLLLEYHQHLLWSTLPLDRRYKIRRGPSFHTTRVWALNSILKAGSWLVGDKHGKGLGNELNYTLVVGESQALEQSFTDELSLGLLGILAQRVIPVVPTPPELKQEIKRHLRKKWINKNRRQATSASINKMIIIIVYFQKLFIHNKSTNIGADLLKVLS